MGNEVFENLVNQHADRSRCKRLRKAKAILALMGFFTAMSLIAFISYWTGLSQSGFNLTLGTMSAVACAFCAGRIAEMRI